MVINATLCGLLTSSHLAWLSPDLAPCLPVCFADSSLTVKLQIRGLDMCIF